MGEKRHAVVSRYERVFIQFGEQRIEIARARFVIVRIGDGVALSGVAKYPARVKCALLSWMAFTDALHQAEGAPQ